MQWFESQTLNGAGVIGLLWWLQPTEAKYGKPLGDSLLFYESHRSGKLAGFRAFKSPSCTLDHPAWSVQLGLVRLHSCCLHSC